jgi:peptide/nickel transport system substrate-binding protein
MFILVALFASILAACGSSSPTTAGQTPASAATTAPAAQATATRSAPATAVVPTLAVTQSNASSAGNVAKVPPLPTVPANAKKGGTLTVANSGPLPTNLPANPNSTETVGAWFNLRGLLWAPGLMSFNFTSLEWQLEYAQELKVDETGKVLTFKLRPDLKWSDGSPITVDDFQFTFDSISKPNKENPALNYARLADTARVASFKSDAATGTITITLIQAFARDLALYYSIYAPTPKKVWEGKPYSDSVNNPEIKKPSVVSGPYKIDNYDPSSQGTFVANPNWHRGKPNFDTIVVKSFAANLVYDAIKTGQADISLDALPSARYSEIKADTSVKVYEWTPANPNWRYIAYNMTTAPFNDKVMRQAVAYALDRDTIIRLAEGGRAIPMYTFLNETSPYYNPEVQKYAFSMDKSKKLLEDGGYKLQNGVLMGKDGQPIKVTLIHETTDQPGKLMATYLQAQLKGLGIEVQVETREPQSYLSALISKKYDFATSTTGLVFPDPDTPKYFYVSDGVFNVAGLKNARVDELFKNGSSELDTAKRKQIYNEIQTILAEELPLSIIYGRIPYVAASAKMGGIVPSKGRIDENTAFAAWYLNQ